MTSWSSQLPCRSLLLWNGAALRASRILAEVAVPVGTRRKHSLDSALVLLLLAIDCTPQSQICEIVGETHFGRRM